MVKNMDLNKFYGIKLGQTQTFTEGGDRIPVTPVFVEPMTVVQVKTVDKDGYVSLKVCFGERKAKNISKSVKGELNKIKNYELKITNKESKTEEKEEKIEKADKSISENPLEIRENPGDEQKVLPRYLREIRIKDNQEVKDIKIGDKINVADVFKEGETIHVSGVGIGKGFAGVVKRHGFKGGPRTHGQSDRERSPGSIGQTTTPGRVYLGKRMAGRMGGLQTTVKNLSVAKIDSEKNIILVKGLVPGKKKGVVILYK
jgi:large subunit ribosomal protein L3